MTKIKIPQEAWALVTMLLVVGISYFASILLVAGNQEVTNPNVLLQLTYYPQFLIIGAVVVLSLYFTRKIWSQDNKYGNGFGFFNIGQKPALPQLKNYSGFQLFLLSIIGFGILFLSASYGKILGSGWTAISSLPTTSQQFSPGSALAFSTLLVPASEELFMLAIMGILVLILTLVAVKFNMSKQEYNRFYFGIIPLLIGVLAIILHDTVYQNSTVSLIVVFVFWTIKALLDLAIGFFVIGWVMHMMNNFFIDFSRIYSSSQTFGVVIGIIAFLIILYFALYGSKKSKKGG